MKHHAFGIALVFTALALLPAPPVHAQATGPAQSRRCRNRQPSQPAPKSSCPRRQPTVASRTIVPLKLNVVRLEISERQEVSSLPYSISANHRQSARAREHAHWARRCPTPRRLRRKESRCQATHTETSGSASTRVVSLHEAGRLPSGPHCRTTRRSRPPIRCKARLRSAACPSSRVSARKNSRDAERRSNDPIDDARPIPSAEKRCGSMSRSPSRSDDQFVIALTFLI